MNKIKFVLNGCDISFIAEAPEDIKLKDLLKQCDRIIPDWCSCGICTADEKDKVELIIDYNSINKVNDDVFCKIKEVEE